MTYKYIPLTYWNRATVISLFKKTKSGTMKGPDNVSIKTLKSCASALGSVFQNIFNGSLTSNYVPRV